MLPLFAALEERTEREPVSRGKGTAITGTAAALVVLLAGMALAQAGTYLAERRRHILPAEQAHPGYDAQFYTAAAALRQLGLPSGGKLAGMGDQICYVDQYWARLAGAQILAEVEAPGDPETTWNAIPDKRTVTAPLASQGIDFLITEFPNSLRKPEGWVQLGPTNLFAYPLQRALAPEQAAAVASFVPQP